MNGITNENLSRAELVLLISVLTYFLMNGAQIFETAVLIPKWTSRPPHSLSVLQGEYAPDLKSFWIITHCIHELTFIAAIGFCWQLSAVRNTLLLIFALHFAVRLWTIGYFAPQIMGFQKADTSLVTDQLVTAVARWRNLNYLRVAIFVALSVWVAFVYASVRDTHAKSLTIKHQRDMEQRLSVITVGVDDLSAQTAFYKTWLECRCRK